MPRPLAPAGARGHVVEGPARIILATDRRRYVEASWARLERGVVTAWTPRGVRSWSARELARIDWHDVEQVAA